MIPDPRQRWRHHPTTRHPIELIRELTAHGWTQHQIAARRGVASAPSAVASAYHARHEPLGQH